MNFLLLIKHSLPEIIPAIPARDWNLSAAGKQRCVSLADTLRPFQPDLFISSLEPKATETAEITAKLMGKPFRTAPNLHEHERRNVGWFDRTQFEASAARLFQYPDQLVFGEETANQAHARFKQAVERLLAEHPGQTLAIVAHGTVIALFTSRAASLEPFPLWQHLGLPGLVVLSRPDLQLVKTVAQIG